MPALPLRARSVPPRAMRSAIAITSVVPAVSARRRGVRTAPRQAATRGRSGSGRGRLTGKTVAHLAASETRAPAIEARDTQGARGEAGAARIDFAGDGVGAGSAGACCPGNGNGSEVGNAVGNALGMGNGRSVAPPSPDVGKPNPLGIVNGGGGYGTSLGAALAPALAERGARGSVPGARGGSGRAEVAPAAACPRGSIGPREESGAVVGVELPVAEPSRSTVGGAVHAGVAGRLAGRRSRDCAVTTHATTAPAPTRSGNENDRKRTAPPLPACPESAPEGELPPARREPNERRLRRELDAIGPGRPLRPRRSVRGGRHPIWRGERAVHRRRLNRRELRGRRLRSEHARLRTLPVHRRFERQAHLGRAREAQLRARRHRAVHETGELSRHVRRDVNERDHLAALHLRGDDPRVLALHRAPPGDHLVEHDADGIEVAPRVDLVGGERLLRRHVLGGPHEHAGHRQAPLPGYVRPQLGDPEVDQLQNRLRPLVGDEDVLRLEIAMGHPERVGGLERVQDLADEVARRGDR